MCGFAALAGADASAPGVIERGVRALAHRGPDGSGIWRAPDGRAALGHTRLAIIDLSDGGAQPMVSRSGREVIAFNGEIYNFRELASRLSEPPRSTSDTEVLLQLLGQLGSSAIPLLRGMFAFAYWDGTELLLVRDRIGIKPLFYAASEASVAAASEITALLSMGSAPRKIDYRAVDDYLTYLYVPPPRTGFVGLSELPPGHLLRWRAGRPPRIERYWSVPIAPRRKTNAHEVRDLIEDAVRSHLVSDTDVGVFLSGGLDSSTIAAFAARHYGRRLRTFTITFGEEGRYLDERTFAREIAERFSTQHTEIRVEPNVAEILPELIEHFGQPFGNPTAVLTYALSRATRGHVKVVLAGDGGDEVLGGYPRYGGLLAAGAAKRLPSVVERALRAGIDRFAPRQARGKLGHRLRRFGQALDAAPEEMYFRWVTYLDGERKNRLFVDRAALLGADAPSTDFQFLAELRDRAAQLEMVDAAPFIDLQSFLSQNVLNYGDRMSMAHALEVRVPFCDHKLIEQLAPVPMKQKMPGGVQKGLFRWAMKGILPADVILHRKVGFNPPIADWLRGPLNSILTSALSPKHVEQRGLFASTEVRSMIDRFNSGDSTDGHTLWSLAVLESWLNWTETHSSGNGHAP